MLDPVRQQPTTSFQFSDEIGHTTPGYQTWDATNSVFWPSKPTLNYRNNRSLSDRKLQFGKESKECDESGISSPPLRTTSLPRSPQHLKNRYRSLSPASRTQAIERGQKELMDMLKNMPESSYELTLKDLVEHQEQENSVKERNSSEKKVYNRGGSGKKKVDKKEQGKSSGNFDRDVFYLKMVFPVYLGLKNKKTKKKNESLGNSSSKVSPRPSASDKEWWKKRPSACDESESGPSSINRGSMKSPGSSSSSRRSRSNSRHEKSGGGCCPFIRSTRRHPKNGRCL